MYGQKRVPVLLGTKNPLGVGVIAGFPGDSRYRWNKSEFGHGIALFAVEQKSPPPKSAIAFVERLSPADSRYPAADNLYLERIAAIRRG
jgi:hypothetical protein